jgi:hypothetical protein
MPKYAVIIAVTGSAAPGKVLSTHRSARTAEANRPVLPDAYVARGKPGGEWETQDEVRERLATRAPRGAKRRLTGGARHNVYLDDATLVGALAMGGGELSAGLRLAVKKARGEQ